jgi:hypothetical protein
MQLRFFTTCLAALITASMGVGQDTTFKPVDPFETDPPVYPDSNAPTPARQIQILNPDGTSATDAKAIAIKTIGIAMPVVDTNLELLPNDPRGKQSDRTSMTKLENNNGTVSLSADAKAIVASNDDGFLFLPSGTDVETAQLRSWANVKIDTSSIPVDIVKDKLWLRISWSNNFCGMYPGNGLMDGVGFPAAKKDPSPDWRFDPFVTWCRDVKVSENTDTFRVPPGEVSVMLTDIDPKKSQRSGVSYHMAFGKTMSNKTTEIVFPKFGSFRGTLVTATKLGLPDWGQSGKTQVATVPLGSKFPAQVDLHRRFGNIPTPNAISVNGKPIVAPTSQNWNHYADFLSTDAGFSVRTSGFGSRMAEVEPDGTFFFPLVAVSDYTLNRLTPVTSPPELISTTGDNSKPVGLSFSAEAIFQFGDEQRTRLKVTVKENECIDLGKLDASLLESSETVTYSPLPDAKPKPGTIIHVDQNVVRNGKTEVIQVAKVVTEDGSLRVATPEDFEKAAAAGIPFINPNPRIIQPGEVIGLDYDSFTKPTDAKSVPANLPPGSEIVYDKHTEIRNGKEVTVAIPRIIQHRSTDPFQQADDLNAQYLGPAPQYVPGFQPYVAPAADQNPMLRRR